MSWLIADTLIQARAIRPRIDTALGLPRAASEAERHGAGPHTALALCRTERWSRIARLKDGRFAVRIKQRILKHLTAMQRGAVVDELPTADALLSEDDD